MINLYIQKFLTDSLLVSNAGNTSLTVRSTNTPPIILKHFLSLSTSFNVSITRLKSRYTLNLSLERKQL